MKRSLQICGFIVRIGCIVVLLEFCSLYGRKLLSIQIEFKMHCTLSFHKYVIKNLLNNSYRGFFNLTP